MRCRCCSDPFVGCPPDCMSRTLMVTCSRCGQDCACEGCITEERRLGQEPRPR